MCSVHVTGANWMKTLSRSHDTVRLCSLAATSFANVLFHFIDFSLQSYTFYADFSSCHIQWRRNSLPAVLQLHTLFAKDGSASLGKWHARTLNRIAVGWSLERRSDRPVIGGDPRTRTWLGDGDRDLLSLETESSDCMPYSCPWVGLTHRFD